MDAGNQQERFKTTGWIVGFTDGEGCFSVSIFRNKTSRFGWQVMPEFVITQSAKSLKVLQMTQKYFGCGKIFINKRYDNHHEHLYRYCVRNRDDLNKIIIPFFINNPLLTEKRRNFELFRNVLSLMNKDEHLNEKGLQKIGNLIGKKLF